MRILLAALFLVGSAAAAVADIKTQSVEYDHNGIVMHGYLAYDDASDARRPGVLVAHEWWGVSDYEKRRARMLAEQGYVALAIDMYGGGKRTEHASEANEWMQQVTANMDDARARFDAALEVLAGHELVAPARVAAIGYCFGGGVVLGMALSGVDIAGVASFHGGLPADAVATGEVTASVLICNGAADPFSQAESVANLQSVLEAAGADWTLINYGGAKHSFTVPASSERGIEALEYNASADARSWRELLNFLEEIFSSDD